MGSKTYGGERSHAGSQATVSTHPDNHIFQIIQTSSQSLGGPWPRCSSQAPALPQPVVESEPNPIVVPLPQSLSLTKPRQRTQAKAVADARVDMVASAQERLRVRSEVVIGGPEPLGRKTGLGNQRQRTTASREAYRHARKPVVHCIDRDLPQRAPANLMPDDEERRQIAAAHAAGKRVVSISSTPKELFITLIPRPAAK